MEIKNIYGAVIYTSQAATVKDAVVEAVAKKSDLTGADLRGANLTGADLTGADLRSADLTGADLRGANLTGADLTGADLRSAYLTGADLRGANLRGAYLRGADGEKKNIITMRVFTGIYRYQVWAVLFEDGTRWVRMGCYFKSLEEWGDGIRKSNEAEFPDDGSDKSEERVAAFEFAKAAALKMVSPEPNTSTPTCRPSSPKNSHGRSVSASSLPSRSRPTPTFTRSRKLRDMEYFREKDGLTFTEEGHRYELNGQRVISLTQIIAAAGLIDYSAVNPQVLEDKAKFGTKIHEYYLWLSKGDLDMDDLCKFAD